MTTRFFILGLSLIVLCWGCASSEFAAPRPEPAVYRCLPHGEWPTPGRCPTCGHVLTEASSERTIFKCPKDRSSRSTPGPCPGCGMSLGESNRVIVYLPAKGILYKCPQDDSIRNTPGPCSKCGRKLGAMEAVPESPGGWFYRCPMQEGVRPTVGPCPHCGMPLSESNRVPYRE